MNLSQEFGVFGTGNTILMEIKDKKYLCTKTNRRNQKCLRKMIRAARRGEKNKSIREAMNEMEKRFLW